MPKKEVVKNNIADRDDENPTVEVKLDKKKPKKVVRMNRKDAAELVKKYKKQCEPFPVRMLKYKRKEESLKKWVASHPE